MPNSFSKELSLNYFSTNLSDYWNLNYAIKECYPSEQSCFWIIKLYVSMTNIAIEASNLATHSSVLAWRIPGIRGAWWAAVYGVAQSRTWLKQLSSSSSSMLPFGFSGIIWYHRCLEIILTKILSLKETLVLISIVAALFSKYSPYARHCGNNWNTLCNFILKTTA